MYVHCTYMYLRCPDVFLFLSKLNEVITLHSIHYYGTIYNTLFSTRITVPRNTIVPKHNDGHITRRIISITSARLVNNIDITREKRRAVGSHFHNRNGEKRRRRRKNNPGRSQHNDCTRVSIYTGLAAARNGYCMHYSII